MTRKCLSPTATVFAKIGLFFIEVLIELFNLISYPVRKISLQAYSVLSLICGGLLVHFIYSGQTREFNCLFLSFVVGTVFILLVNRLYKYLNKKVMPRVAYLFNSPLGIPTNKFYNC